MQARCSRLVAQQDEGGCVACDRRCCWSWRCKLSKVVRKCVVGSCITRFQNQLNALLSSSFHFRFSFDAL